MRDVAFFRVSSYKGILDERLSLLLSLLKEREEEEKTAS